VGVMAFIKYTHNCSDIFLKLKVVVAFLKYAKIANVVDPINPISLGYLLEHVFTLSMP
jgi:hypothetical protein